MKKNQILTIPLGIFFISLLNISAFAQTNVNIENLADNLKQKKSLQFIDGVNLIPEKSVENRNNYKTDKTDKTNTTNTTNVTEVGDNAEDINNKVNKLSTKENTIAIEKCSGLQFKYALLMNVEVEDITNINLYALIDEWWATPYHYGGSDKSGIDCSAFSSKILSTVYGINLPRTSADQYAMAQKISLQDLKEGDLVFFNPKGSVSHVGVYLGNNFFVHSSVASGVTISSLTDDYYSRKFIGGGRAGVHSYKL